MKREIKTRLKDAGFLDSEIEIFVASTKPIDLTIPFWQRAMKSRREWIDRMIARGWTKAGIGRKISEFYTQDKRRTPWDFLSHTYNMPKQAKEAIKQVTTTKIWPDRHVSFTKSTAARLDAYLEQYYPGHRALSMVVDKAVVEYLDRHENNGKV